MGRDLDFIMVYITCPGLDEAKKITNHLLERRLIACGNIIPGLVSRYRWKDAVQEDGEVLLICKTQSKHWEKIKSEVEKIHSYEIPCILSYRVEDGNLPYLNWVINETE
jgi:periplasmic divalent cation tolerance protein